MVREGLKEQAWIIDPRLSGLVHSRRAGIFKKAVNIEVNKNLTKKSEIIKIIKGMDPDEYLRSILEEYENFIEQEKSDLDYCIEQNQETLLEKLTSEAMNRTFRGSENEQLKLIKKFEKRITKKQEGITKRKEEMRKLLISEIKKIRW